MQATNASQMSVIDSGSTNRPGFTIKMDLAGNATIEQRHAETKSMTIDPAMCQQLSTDIEAAGSLSALPEKHCAKSASFGSSLYVEVNGVRSPDLSCPQEDPHVLALKKDANAILAAVRSQLGPMRPVRPIRPLTTTNR